MNRKPRRRWRFWFCWTCGQTFTYYAPAERHADTHGGARIEMLREVHRCRVNTGCYESDGTPTASSTR